MNVFQRQPLLINYQNRATPGAFYGKSALSAGFIFQAKLHPKCYELF